MATRTTGRIKIPKNPGELLDLAKKINDKHVADGENSPLKAMQDFSWDVEGAKVAICKQNHDEAEEAARRAEQRYRQRDIDLPVINDLVRNSAALLKTIYAKNPKVLGDYGLDVDDSKQAKATPPQV